MKLSELLSEDVIKIGLDAKAKEPALEELVALLVKSGRITDGEAGLRAIRLREKLQSTGIGRGLAIPHGKDPSVKALAGCMGISKDGIEYESLDGELVKVVFLLLAEKSNPGPHIEALSQVAKLFMMDGFMEKLLAVTTPREVLTVLAEYEEGQED